jgi:hypothetical protein
MSNRVGSYSDGLVLHPKWRCRKSLEVKVEVNHKSPIVRLQSGAVRRDVNEKPKV